MIPIFLQNTVKNNNHLVNNLINSLLTVIDQEIQNSEDPTNLSLRSGSFNYNTVEQCGRFFDITKFIPTWVAAEKNARSIQGSSTLTIFDIIQLYYDWLYCDGASGAQYGLSKNILELIDIKKTKNDLIQNLYNIYAESFTDIFDDTAIKPGRIQLENFFNNIRTQFYHKKGTEEGLRKLLTTLFVIDDEDIIVEYPKTYILRLNGGKFYDSKFNFRTNIGDTGSYLEKGDLSGSYLNFSRLHDNSWFHDYSYLVYAGNGYNNLEEVYKKSNHPIGTKLLFGYQISDFEPPQPDDFNNSVCEYPLLRNYAPYAIGSTYPALGVINGATYYGLTYGIGCCGISFSGFTGPTHVFPSWNQTILQDKFSDINIQDFIILCYSDGITSPNENLTCSG